MSNDGIFMLELYNEFNETLDYLREDIKNIKQVLSALDDIGENISELTTTVAAEAEQLTKFCNRVRCFEDIRLQKEKEEPKQ